MVHNVDDPILGEGDVRFLNETLGSRVTWFDCGGHLGNLYLAEYQNVLLEILESPVKQSDSPEKSTEKPVKEGAENAGTEQN